MMLYQPRPNVPQRGLHAKYRGVEDSVSAMQYVTRQGQSHPEIRNWVEEVIREVTPKDYLSELAAVYYDVCKRVRYTRDPANFEQVRHPWLSLQRAAADCDDLGVIIASAIASGVMSVGNEAQYAIVGFIPNAPEPSKYTHVLARVRVDPGKRWIILDPVAGPQTGEMLRQVKAYKFFPIS